MVFMYALFECMYWSVYHLLFKTIESTTLTEAKAFVMCACRRWSSGDSKPPHWGMSPIVSGVYIAFPVHAYTWSPGWLVQCRAAKSHLLVISFSLLISAPLTHFCLTCWWNVELLWRHWRKKNLLKYSWFMTYFLLTWFFFLQIRFDWCEGWTDYCYHHYCNRTLRLSDSPAFKTNPTFFQAWQCSTCYTAQTRWCDANITEQEWLLPRPWISLSSAVLYVVVLGAWRLSVPCLPSAKLHAGLIHLCCLVFLGVATLDLRLVQRCDPWAWLHPWQHCPPHTFTLKVKMRQTQRWVQICTSSRCSSVLDSWLDRN